MPAGTQHLGGTGVVLVQSLAARNGASRTRAPGPEPQTLGLKVWSNTS